MRYELMRPQQIRDAIAGDVPFVMALGVLEYHGEHLPLGVDALAVSRVIERLEAEDPERLVILPQFPYGAASHAVRGAEGGHLHIGSDALLPFARALFAGLLRTGVRRLHVVVHHQTENFAQGMPTDLAFRLAARDAIFAHLETERGEGWWGAADMERYYADHARGENPFNWIRVHPLFAPDADFPFDHAGPGETGLMLALAPETVDMHRVSEGDHWYVRGAEKATASFGGRGAAIALDRLRALLFDG